MSGMFGGKSNATTAPSITGLQIQTSAYGKVLPIVYGLTRIAGNLIWYNDFKTMPGKSSGSSGKGGLTGGGGKGSSAGSDTYSAAVAIAMCEGPIAGFGAMWSSQTLTSLASVGLTAFDGTYTQTAWGYLTTNHPSEALAYVGTAYAAGNLNLGNSASLPNYNFEIQGIFYNTAPIANADADPSLVVVDLLTNAYYGAGFPANRIGTLNTANEAHTIPAGAGPTITVTNHAAFQYGIDVEIASGATFKCVAASPSAGQYSFNPGTGVYSFNTADAGTAITITYTWLGGLTSYQNYALGSGLWISPAYTSQSQCSAMLDDIATYTDSRFVWSAGVLSLIPNGAVSVSWTGGTYTPPSAPEFDLGDDDFMKNQGSSGASAAMSDDPVILTRLRASDQVNDITLEFLDRTNAYATSTVEITDQALIQSAKRKVSSNMTAHLFADPGAAHRSAQLLMQRQYIRNTFSITLDMRYCLLDPMDLVTLTDAGLGLNKQPARVTAITENDDGSLSVGLEEYPAGLGQAAVYNLNTGSGYIADYGVSPGSINAPVIFEPPPAMLAAYSITAPQIVIAASGGPNWSGCDVWASLDGTTFDHFLGRITAPARQGVLTSTLAIGSDPDTTHTLAVDLSESAGTLLSGVQADADAFRTLCYVDGELIAYETATLTGTNKYGLTYLRRGVFGTTIAAHAAGAKFARLDRAVGWFDLPVSPVSYVGQTIYLKFTSYNIYDAAEESIAGVAIYSYNPNGAAEFVYPPSGVGFTVGAEQQKDGSWLSYGVVSWTASPDPLFDQYEVQYRLHSGPGPWISWRGGPGTTSFRISPLPANTAYDVQVRAVRTSGPFYSAWAQNLNVTTVGKTAAPPAPTSASCSGGYRTITLDWLASAENDIAWYEVYESADNVLAHGSRIALINGTHYVRPGLNLTDTRYYWVRAQDTSGNFSTYLGPVSATTLGVDAADITGQIIAGQIAANAISASNLISGLNLVQVVSSIGSANPSTSDLAYETSSSKIYRWNGSSWTTAVAGSDIIANSVTASQIAGGTITAAQIQAGGITGANIAGGTITGSLIAGLTITAANMAAGTITGDKITGNFFQGYDFNASGGGTAKAQIYGGQFTASGLTYGPYFCVVDGSNQIRFIAGQWAGQYGLHVWNAAGTKILDAGDLGVSVVGTSNIITNAVNYPYGVNMTAGNFVLWSHSADVTGILAFSASIGVFHAGGAMGTPPGKLKLTINGTDIVWSDAPNGLVAFPVSLGYSVAVTAGDNIQIHWVETTASTTDTSGGSLFANIFRDA